MMTLRSFRIAAVLFTATSLPALGGACSDGSRTAPDSQVRTDGHAHVDADCGTSTNDESCEHLQQGPFADVTAGASAAAAAEVKADHRAYRVALASGAAGYVKYAAGAIGELAIFADQALPLEVQDDKGKALVPDKTETSITECAVVKGKVTVDLALVGSYFLKLGPSTSVSKVTLVLEESGHCH